MSSNNIYDRREKLLKQQDALGIRKAVQEQLEGAVHEAKRGHNWSIQETDVQVIRNATGYNVILNMNIHDGYLNKQAQKYASKHLSSSLWKALLLTLSTFVTFMSAMNCQNHDLSVLAFLLSCVFAGFIIAMLWTAWKYERDLIALKLS